MTSNAKSGWDAPAPTQESIPPRPTVTVAACLELAGLWWLLCTCGMAALVGLLLGIGALEAQSLQQARMQITLQEIRERLESDLALGFELAASSGAQALLEDTLTQDASLLALDVISPDGMAVFSTDHGTIGERVPHTWHLALEQWRPAQQPADVAAPVGWTAEVESESTQGLPIYGPFGELAGHVCATSRSLRPPHAMPLMKVAALMWLLFSLVAGLVVWRSLVINNARSNQEWLLAAAARLVRARNRINGALTSLTRQEGIEP